ncbi:MAG: enoyl-CoA hydratase/isomerase family protein [Actinobacteria bacterium]|nr:enoyl-CoA hydratase/isomerase family protein [Actinomycetota bacterium]
MTDEDLLSTTENNVRWLTINRPDSGNAITPDVRNRIIDHLAEANESYDIRAVVITASGEKHFCTGADLRAGGAQPPPKPEGMPERVTGDASRMIRSGIQRLIGGILDCEKPVIAAVNGTAAGGGAQIVMACDLAVAADNARLIQVFVRRGLIPDGGGAYLLPRVVGMKKAKELVFFGDDVNADEAERLGLYNKVVPQAELHATAKEWAERLASGPTRTIGYAKRLLNQSPDVDRATSFEQESHLVELVTATEDCMEGRMSFMERRDPEFKGW